MISHFRSLWEWDIVWWESKRGQTKHHLFGEFTTPIHLCVCLKGEISCKETIKTAATAKDLLKNQTEQEDAKLKMFVWWIRTESLPPFGPIVISFLDSFSPHTSEMWNIPCEIRMTSTKAKPMLEEYYAVGGVLRSCESFIGAPTTWSCPRLPLSWKTVLSAAQLFYNRRRPLNPNWTGHTMIDGGTRTVDYISWKPVLNRDSSKDGHCGGLEAASIGLCTGYSSSLYWAFLQFDFHS